jgi:uncharacterized protein YdeI (YjbR/CyaY-like superfamily)
MTLIFFKTPAEFRKWLEINHEKKPELFVGFYKKESKKPSLTWPQSVDEALCYGWIDGVRKSIDAESYCIRFTPRKPTSIWSAVNISKIEELIRSGKMNPAGLAAFKNRREDKSKIYSFENDEKILEGDLKKQFMSNLNAWNFFNSQAPSYKKAVVYWIMSASQEKTRFSRLDKTMAASEKQKRLWDKYK